MLPDFYGPIEVQPSPGRGRGTFATCDIQAGTLVLAEKALGVVSEGEIERLMWKGSLRKMLSILSVFMRTLIKKYLHATSRQHTWLALKEVRVSGTRLP